MHAQQEIGARPEQRRIEQQFILDVIERQRRHARCDATVQRQPAGERKRRAQQANAARNARLEGDEALAGQRAQMLVDTLAVAQLQCDGEIATGGRPAVPPEECLDLLEYLALAGAGFGGGVVHGRYHTNIWYRFKAGRSPVLGLELYLSC